MYIQSNSIPIINQNPPLVQTQITIPQQSVQIINPQTNPVEAQQFFNLSQGMNLGIQENFNDPINQMINSMGMSDMGMGMNPNQIFQRMIQTMNQLENGGGDSSGVNIQGMINMQGLGNGTMISKQYVSKIDYSDGTPKKESYQSQSIKQFGNDGHNISERQEAYKNSSTGLQQAALQRLLDDKGTKIIRQRNILTGSHEQHNLYQGITENDLNNFNKQYTDYRDKIHFQDNYKYLSSIPSSKDEISKYLLGAQNNSQQGIQNSNQIMGQLPSGTNFISTTTSIPQNQVQLIPNQYIGTQMVQSIPQPISQIPSQVIGNTSILLPNTNQVLTQNNNMVTNAPNNIYARVQRLG